MNDSSTEALKTIKTKFLKRYQKLKNLSRMNEKTAKK